MLARRKHNVTEEEIGAGCAHRPRPVNDQPPSTGCGHLRALHSEQTFNVITHTEEDEPGRSSLQRDMPVPDHDKPDCEPPQRHKVKQSQWGWC